MDETISRQAAIDALKEAFNPSVTNFVKAKMTIDNLPPAQPKAYTKADYVMALHKEYGCTLTRAEEAHDKALEYLRSKTTMKG